MKNIFTFKGRLNRMQFFLHYILMLMGAVCVFGIVLVAYGRLTPPGELIPSKGGLTILSIAFLVSVITFFLVGFFMCAFSVRRLRDFGQSGWWAILTFVPTLNFIFFLFLIMYPGTPTTGSANTPIPTPASNPNPPQTTS